MYKVPNIVCHRNTMAILFRWTSDLEIRVPGLDGEFTVSNARVGPQSCIQLVERQTSNNIQQYSSIYIDLVSDATKCIDVAGESSFETHPILSRMYELGGHEPEGTVMPRFARCSLGRFLKI
jgi:hypothetical protein